MVAEQKVKAFEIENFSSLIQAAVDNADNAWDEEFATNMQEKFKMYDDDMFISDNQLIQLERISGIRRVIT